MHRRDDTSGSRHPGPRSARDVGAGVALTALAVWLWLQAGSYPDLPEGYPGPALFPRLIAVGLGGAGLAVLAGGLRRGHRPRETAAPSGTRWRGAGRLGAGLLLVVLYPFLEGLVGFIPTVSALCFGVAVLLGVRLRAAAPTAIAATVLIYWLFTGLLGVPL